ncbi:MAG: BamA/TamA family outer membrane protein, partial [Thermoanaerobaculia bacterium]
LELAAARRRLWETGLFSHVMSRTDRSAAGTVGVVFDIEERERFSVAYGVRWDSDEGSRAVVDLVDRNFLGRNILIGLRGLYADDDESIRFHAAFPRVFGRGALKLFTSVREDVREGIISERLEGTLQFSHPMGQRVTARIYGRYKDTRLTEEDPDPFFPLDERIRSPLLGVQLLYDGRREPVLSPQGVFASLDLSGSEEFLDSDFRYARLFGQIQIHHPIARWGSRGLSWGQSFQIGVAGTFGGQELLRDPRFGQRFFAGGEYSVRGYRTESLGPQEVLGSLVRPLGGEALLVVNQELRLGLFEPLSSLVFFDAGNVWADPGDFASDLFKSVGLGLRALTPVGLLRLDFAWPLDRREIDPEYKLYFGLGNTF